MKRINIKSLARVQNMFSPDERKRTTVTCILSLKKRKKTLKKVNEITSISQINIFIFMMNENFHIRFEELVKADLKKTITLV